MQCWEVVEADLNNWVPGSRFFATSDGKYFVVDADLMPAPGFVSNVIRRNTCVFYCTETAGVTDLIPDFECDPMTPAEEAVALMGYELVPAPEPAPEIPSTPTHEEEVMAEMMRQQQAAIDGGQQL